jgi:hypothetical protein
MLCRKFSSSYTEHNKIGFVIFGFFYDFIWILQLAGKNTSRGKNHFSQESLELFNFTTLPSALTPGPYKALALTELPSARDDPRWQTNGPRLRLVSPVTYWRWWLDR